MKRVIVVLLAVLLTGCGVIDPLIARGGDAYDKALMGAEEFQCRIASARSVIDRYARDETTWNAWLHICGYARESVPRPEPKL